MKRSQETVNTRNISGVFNVLRRSDQNQNISSLNGFSEFERKAWLVQKYMLKKTKHALTKHNACDKNQQPRSSGQKIFLPN